MVGMVFEKNNPNPEFRMCVKFKHINASPNFETAQITNSPQ